MRDLDEELCSLGVPVKTEHNEVAPSQHELAVVYEEANISLDHNQLVMESLKKVASRHGLECLLHEKPFSGVNGSGKHNNWSLTTDDGINLMNPGESPHENVQFLLVLACVLAAVDSHSELLRMSAANVGNDHRLGADEARHYFLLYWKPAAGCSRAVNRNGIRDKVKEKEESDNGSQCSSQCPSGRYGQKQNLSLCLYR